MKLHREWIDDPPYGSPPERELHERISAPLLGVGDDQGITQHVELGFLAERPAA